MFIRFWLAGALSILHLLVMWRLVRYRKRHTVFFTRVDLIDPRNYDPPGRVLIVFALLTLAGAVAAWANAFRAL